jgi:hypothetical protein
MNIEEENIQLKKQILELKEQLSKYTCPERSKIFYENNKEKILKKNQEYKEKTNYYANLSSEKKKEYAHTAYLNKKNKMSL